MSVGADANQPEVHANKMARVEDTLRVKKISEHAVLPVRGREDAAGHERVPANPSRELRGTRAFPRWAVERLLTKRGGSTSHVRLRRRGR